MDRPDVPVTQERIDDLRSKIKGHYALPPEAYASEDLGGTRFYELPEEALRMIDNNWMCGDCLAMFRVPLLRCPACFALVGSHQIVSRAKVPDAALWDEHRKALDEAQPRDRLPQRPMAPDEWISRIVGNSEGATISSLKKSRKGARRS